MRKLQLFILLICTINCFSQNKQILYNFTSVPQTLLTNPGADFKYKGYFGIPLLSGISANIGSSGFSAFDLFANDGVDFNTKLSNVLNDVSNKDKLYINEQFELINGGFKIGDWQKGAYLSFGLYQEFDMLTYLPKDPALLALNGNRNYIGKVFNLGDLNAKAEMLSVFHFGFHKNISEKLIVGVRGKIYSSVFNISSTNNSGYFYTIPSTNTIYEQVISSNIQVNTSGISNYTSNYTGNVSSDIIKKMLLGGNLGLGFDAGFTYYPKKNLQFTASILDVGFIKHAKDVESYTYKGYYKYEGIAPDFTDPNASQDVFQEFKDAIPFDTLQAKYTTWRPIKLNASIQYSFGDGNDSSCNCQGKTTEYKNAFGAQLYAMSTPRTPFMALTTYFRRKFLKGLEAKATYTIDSFSYKNIGLGVSTTIGKFNLYLVADNLLEYRDISKAKSLSFQFGLNVVLRDKNTPD